VDAGEACDDGNDDDRDACRNTCERARCGDGVAWLGVEPCDDGNNDDGDACLTTCRIARCGDGMLRRGVEACDDGNTRNGDGCSDQCQEEGQNLNRPPLSPRISIVGQAERSVAFSGIEVTLGRDPEGQLVQAICWSLGSNHSSEARAFESRFGRGGQTAEVTLTWTTTGTKTITCKTRDEQRALSGTDQERVTVQTPNRSPSSPRITVEGSATSNQPFEFSVRLGTDPDRDQVQALCWSSGSNHSTSRDGVVSALVNSGGTTTVSLTWRTAGSRTVYCRTRDEHGEDSGTWDTERVQVENPNRAPYRPTISTNGDATTRQPFEVRVLLGRDPDRDEVRAKCWSTGSDYPSERSAARSELTSGGRTAVLQFTWRSSGTNSLYCETEDEHGMVSTSRDRESVRVAN
jgi:cysteine-rich repeat protein